MPSRLALVFALLLPIFVTGSNPARGESRVAVLGYHDFSATEPETEMRIRTEKFRHQMEMLRELKLPVISMEEFQCWKRGEIDLPERSVMITIDDGWKSVYTDAFPVLKEFGYPFTIFLYTNYIDGGGKALTTEMIREMQQHGATIGSHSVGHPYPATVKSVRAQGPEAYQTFLTTQFGTSRQTLESQFGQTVTTYAYPGGFHTEEMFTVAKEAGYESLFTVIPEKVTRDTDDRTLPRYVILGTHDPIFDLAVQFGSVATGDPGALAAIRRPTRHPVQPEPGALVGDRLPTISVDLSQVDDLDPASLSMEILGFGEVPAAWDQATRTFSWTVNRPLRQARYDVEVRWETAASDGDATPEPLRWTFRVDHETLYFSPRDS
jgi:peptidoglycan/xylan/chitin deacetylase (PgdA/CDA1 family)